MSRPRICWFCTEPGAHVVVALFPAVTILRNGKHRRSVCHEGRFVCAAHEALDPWDVTT